MGMEGHWRGLKGHWRSLEGTGGSLEVTGGDWRKVIEGWFVCITGEGQVIIRIVNTEDGWHLAEVEPRSRSLWTGRMQDQVMTGRGQSRLAVGVPAKLAAVRSQSPTADIRGDRQVARNFLGRAPSETSHGIQMS